MSASRKTDYAILVGLGILCSVCLLGVVLWGSLGNQGDLPGARTTHSTGADGAMAAQLLFDRFGIPLRRIESPVLSDSLVDVGVLWIIDPLIPLNAAEMGAIEEWVSAGGVLVSTGLPGRLFEDLRPHDVFGGPYAWGRRFARRRVAPVPRTTQVPDAHAGLPLAAGVTQLRLKTGLTLEADIEDEREDSFRPLFVDTSGIRIAMRRVDDGAVIWLADSSFLSNELIGYQSNGVLATNLALYSRSLAGGGDIGYDEYHLGFGKYESGFSAMWNVVLTTSPGWAVLSLTVAGMLYLIYKGRHFGTRRAPGRPRRRSKLEFVQAAGASFRAAGAHRLAWQLVYGAWKRNTLRELGLPVGVHVGELADRLAQRTGRPAREYGDLLERCERWAHPDGSPAKTPNDEGSGDFSARHLSSLTERLARLERELRDGCSESKSSG